MNGQKRYSAYTVSAEYGCPLFANRCFANAGLDRWLLGVHPLQLLCSCNRFRSVLIAG
jgi:hypothetical protein